MAKLERAAGRVLFAPVIFRLALRLDQVTWSEFTTSASEAVFVLRAAQRLFGLDAVFCWFDTWLEAEAAGAELKRDHLGRVLTAQPPEAMRPVEATLSAAPIAHAVEIVRRLRDEAVPVVGMLTAPKTLRARLPGADPEHLRALGVDLARAYCEAGAGALALVQEEESQDLTDLSEAAAMFNLAEYYATPVMLFARHALSAAGCAVAERLTNGLFITPTQVGAAITPVSDAPQPAAWLALSRWEVPPETLPEDVRAWAHALQPA